MNTIQTVPADLKSVIGTEKVDFSIVAKRKEPLNKSLGIIAFGVIWSAFISFFVIAFFRPLFKGKDVHIKVNDEPTTSSWVANMPIGDKAEITILFFVILNDKNYFVK